MSFVLVINFIMPTIVGIIKSGLFPEVLGKAPGQNWEKMIDLTSNLGEIINIEHN